MTGIMTAAFRRLASMIAPVAVALAAVGRAGADHGNLPPVVRWSPVTIGVIAGVLALAMGLAVVAIVLAVVKKARPPE